MIVFLVLIEIEKEADSRAAENLQDQQYLAQQERRKDVEKVLIVFLVLIEIEKEACSR